MFEILQTVLGELRREPSFADRAQVMLARGVELAQTHLEESAYRTHASIRSGSIHWRSDRGYEGLAVHTSANAPHAELGPSASLWGWMRRYESPMVLETLLGLLSINPQLGSTESMDLYERAEDEPLSASIARYLDSEATHILVMPLIGPRADLVGMFALEFDARAAMGTPFLWETLCPLLEVLLGHATPYLLAGTSGDPLALRDELLPVVGPTMSRRVQILEQFARHDETILLTGASGTGKSRLAKWCHERSSRADGPFEVLDLLSIPEEMQMAHLVGWRRGAFTGAVRDVEGALERACGGTLFIDEIDKLSLRTQAGFLQLLEDSSFRRLGGEGVRETADVRFIVATNSDLSRAVEEGAFREDLFYRINTLPVHLPLLAERRDEIRMWAQYMLERQGNRRAGWSEEALAFLEQQPWPGNLRQLDNVVRRGVIIASMQDSGAGFDVTEQDMREALSMGRGAGGGNGLEAALRRAGEAVASVLLQVEGADPETVWGLPDAVRGYAIQHAAIELGSVDEAFSRFGKESMVRNRNHHRVWRQLQGVMREVRALTVR